MRSGSKAKVRGFTLIELMLVLFIMIAGLAVVAPNISSGQATTQIKTAGRDLVSALRFARGEALISQQQMVLTLDLGDNSYKVSKRDKRFTIPEDIKVTLVTAQSELSGDEIGSIRFFPDGSSTGGRITLEKGENRWLVDVNWLTGHVELSVE